MFEKASRLKLRFATERGNLTAEDLWDLPLTSNRNVNLDDIAKGLSREVKESATESFVHKATSASEALELKFDVVKRVIEVKLAEREAAALKSEAAEKKQRILGIIAKKKDEKLEGSSLEELEAMAATL